CRRRDECGSEALQAAREDQPGVALRERTEGGGRGEEDDAHQEDPLAPDQVTGAAAEEEEAAERERVGVDDPLQIGLGEVQVLLDRRQRDVHDRRVEHDHELRQADEDQHKPGIAPGSHSPKLAATCRWTGGVTRTLEACATSAACSTHTAPTRTST